MMTVSDAMEIRGIYTVVSNCRVAAKTWKMVLAGDTSLFSAPGQFVNVGIEGKFLRRPISVCDYDGETITLLYDVVGEGTTVMSGWTPGHKADLLVALGNGFDISADCRRPLLLGGGVGNAPMLGLAKALVAGGKRPVVVMGFNHKDDVTLTSELEALGIETYVATVDGSAGTRGFVSDAVRENGLDYDYFYACGPLPMLRAVCAAFEVPGQVSLESRMGCGFGACVCCSLETVDGVKRICKDGPVFRKEELIWK